MAMKPMQYKLALFTLGMFLLRDLAPLQSICASQEVTCSYTLEVKTRNKILHLIGGSGTTDPIHVRFRNRSGIEVFKKHLNEGKENTAFKPGQIDTFKLSGHCLDGKICLLDFMVDGTNEWHPENATVHRQSFEEPHIFHFHEKFPQKVWHGCNHCDDDFNAASAVSENYTFGSGPTKAIRKHNQPRGTRRP